MAETVDMRWDELVGDVRDALGQIDGPHRKILAGNLDWLRGLSHDPAFARLSADKLAALLLKLEAAPVVTGEVVIRQKDAGEYFYIVQTGSLTVSRRTGPGEFEMLAQLHPGDSFGESALLSGDARNASVVADNDGMLLRLARADFNALVKTDLVRQVTMLEAKGLVQDGARFLDVRRDTLGGVDVLDGALVIPIDQLRSRLPELDRHTAYVVYCLNGNISETAAFILGRQGYRVYVLKGGKPLYPAGRLTD